MKYALTLLIIGLFSLSAMARMPSPEDRAEHLTTMLDLSEEQATQITAIMSNTQQKALKLMQQLADLRAQTDADIKTLLTEEQAVKFDALQQRKQDMKGPRPERF